METIKFIEEQIDEVNDMLTYFLKKNMTGWEGQSYELALKEREHYINVLVALKTLETLKQLGIKTETK